MESMDKKIESFLVGDLTLDGVGVEDILDLIENMIEGKVNLDLIKVMAGNKTFDGDWDHYFASLAYLVSLKSKDRSTKVGCVITTQDNRIVSTGYNGLVRGMDDGKDEYYDRPLKYEVFEHSERNAIFNAVNLGHSLKDCKIYITGFPCTDCARAIVQSGISSVIIHDVLSEDFKKRWAEKMEIAKIIFQEGGVKVRFLRY